MYSVLVLCTSFKNLDVLGTCTFVQSKVIVLTLMFPGVKWPKSVRKLKIKGFELFWILKTGLG